MSTLIFVCAITHVKKYPSSRNLDMFLQQVTLVCTPKIVVICQILFTGKHRNLNYFAFFYGVLSMSLCDKNDLNYWFLVTISLISTSAVNGFTGSIYMYIYYGYSIVTLWTCALILLLSFVLFLKFCYSSWSKCLLHLNHLKIILG